MSLSDQQIEALRDAICDAFDHDSLEQMLRFRMGRKLYNLVARQGMKDMVFRLLGRFQQEGAIEEFVRAAYAVRPNNVSLRQFCQEHAPFVFEPEKSKRDAATSVRDGLSAIAEIARDIQQGPVREIIRGFQTRFQTIRARIEVLEKYKALHDTLHSLQFRYLRSLKRAAQTFHEEPAAFEELESYVQDLQYEIQQTEEKIEGLTTAQTESGWVQIVQQAIESLRDALSQEEPLRARQAVMLIEGVVAVQPSRINGLLTAAAGSLGLDELIRAMQRIEEEIETSQASESPRQRLRAGRDDLERLQPLLMGSVEQHLHWQRIDNDLRLAERNLAISLEDLQILWPSIWEETRQLIQVHADQRWAVELEQLATEILQAQASSDGAKTRRHFSRYYRAAMLQFFDVDKSLHELAQDLLAIGAPLDTLLEVITDDST